MGDNGWSCNNNYCDFGYSPSYCPDSDACHRLTLDNGNTYAIKTVSLGSPGYTALRFRLDVYARNLESGDTCALYLRYDSSGSWDEVWSYGPTDNTLVTDEVIQLPSPSGHSS